MTMNLKREDLVKGQIYYSETFIHPKDSSIMREQGPFLVLEEFDENSRLVNFLTKKGIESRHFNEERTFIKLST